MGKGKERRTEENNSHAGVMYALSFPGWNNDFEAELEKTSEEFAGCK